MKRKNSNLIQNYTDSDLQSFAILENFDNYKIDSSETKNIQHVYQSADYTLFDNQQFKKLMNFNKNIKKLSKNNVEIIEAYKKEIPIIRRAELLGELLKVKKTSIAISGTHGKTTTSSILGLILNPKLTFFFNFFEILIINLNSSKDSTFIWSIFFFIAYSNSSDVFPTPENTILLFDIPAFNVLKSSPMDTTSAPQPSFDNIFNIAILGLTLTA